MTGVFNVVVKGVMTQLDNMCMINVEDKTQLRGRVYFCSDLFMFRFVQILISKQRMYFNIL